MKGMQQLQLLKINSPVEMPRQQVRRPKAKLALRATQLPLAPLRQALRQTQQLKPRPFLVVMLPKQVQPQLQPQPQLKPLLFKSHPLTKIL
jgi:hypothetical protein